MLVIKARKMDAFTRKLTGEINGLFTEENFVGYYKFADPSENRAVAI